MSSLRSPDGARIDHIIGLLTKSQSNFNEYMSSLNANIERMIVAFDDLSTKLSDVSVKLDELKEICKPRDYVICPSPLTKHIP